MKIFFIRHGETEHNVAQLLAGVTDSRLTQHGHLQTQRLGAHLIDARNLKFTHIFASDLQRAFMTAQAVADAQAARFPQESPLSIPRLTLLREQDFGSNELVPWASKRGQDSFFDRKTSGAEQPGYVPKEPVEVMKRRATDFIDDYIVPLLAAGEENTTVAVVSHGLFLGTLWRDLLRRFSPRSVKLSPDAVGNEFGSNFSPLEHIGIWANTAFLEVEISTVNNTSASASSAFDNSSVSSTPNVFANRALTIHTINGHVHTQGMVKIRGGVSNVPHDPKQRNIAGFFKKDKAAEEQRENTVESGELLEAALDNEMQHADPSPSPMGGVLR